MIRFKSYRDEDASKTLCLPRENIWSSSFSYLMNAMWYTTSPAQKAGSVLPLQQVDCLPLYEKRKAEFPTFQSLQMNKKFYVILVLLFDFFKKKNRMNGNRTSGKGKDRGDVQMPSGSRISSRISCFSGDNRLSWIQKEWNDKEENKRTLEIIMKNFPVPISNFESKVRNESKKGKISNIRPTEKQGIDETWPHWQRESEWYNENELYLSRTFHLKENRTVHDTIPMQSKGERISSLLSCWIVASFASIFATLQFLRVTCDVLRKYIKYTQMISSTCKELLLCMQSYTRLSSCVSSTTNSKIVIKTKSRTGMVMKQFKMLHPCISFVFIEFFMEQL